MWPEHRRTFGILGILVSVSAVCPLSIAWAGKFLIDAVVSMRATAPGAEAGQTTQIIWWLSIEFVLVTLYVLNERTAASLRPLFCSRLSTSISKILLIKTAGLSVADLENPRIAELLARARRDAPAKSLSILQNYFQALRSFILVGAYSVVLVTFSPKIAACLLAIAGCALIAERKMVNSAFATSRTTSTASRWLAYYEYLGTTPEHSKEQRIFDLSGQLVARYDATAAGIFAAERAVALRRLKWGTIMQVASSGAFLGAYAEVIFAAAGSKISLGGMTLYVAGLRQCQTGFSALIATIANIYEDNLYISSLFEFLAVKPSLELVRPFNVAPQQSCPNEQGIRFVDVGFKYEGATSWTLRHVDAFIPPRKLTAIVGRNGSGKSTFMKLATGMYGPTEGVVLLDGIPLGQWEKSRLKSRITALFQDFNRYQLTIRENLGFGDLDREPDNQSIASSLAEVNALYVANRLPRGFDSALGLWFEGGTDLSGGEWQKVALARALFRQAADIIVLDEPNASLDAKARTELFDLVRKIGHDKTVMVISHQQSALRRADHFLYFNQGRVWQYPSLDDLLAQENGYAELFYAEQAVQA